MKPNLKNSTPKPMNEQDYFDAFVDSILSLPGDVRAFILNVGTFWSEDNNPYTWLWSAYNLEEEGAIEPFLHDVLDHHKLAID